MTYTEDGDRIALEMNRAEFESLLYVMGYVAGAIFEDRRAFWEVIKLANEVNRTNPRFVPYAIPPEFALPAKPDKQKRSSS